MMNIDKSFMMIFLLEECNFSCNHCVREDEPMPLGYKLSFEQLKSCLTDCKDLKTIEWVHFSGGEPTLWSEKKRELTDLLIEISKEGFNPGFTTNGSNFINYTNCHNFFKKYLDHSTKRLHLFISIDTFHHNFDVGRKRAKSLDNVIRCKRDIPSEKRDLLNITALTTISIESESLLPEKMIEYYGSQGVKFSFIPLDSKGKAKSLGHLCPNLSSDKPEDLGAYYRYHKMKGETEKKSNIILIGNDYYFYENDYSIGFTKRWHKFAQLGQLAERIKDIKIQ